MIITQTDKAGTSVLCLSGQMDFHSHKPFLQAIENAKCTKPHQIILNLSDVPFINSAGLGILMLAQKSLAESQIRLSLEVPEGYVKEVLTLTSIDKIIPISVAKPKSSPPTISSCKSPLTPPSVFDSVDRDDLLLPILKKLEKKEFDLPPLSKTAGEVLTLLTDPQAHMSKLTTLIQQDPVLTSKILKTANSAAYGTPRQIASLSQAIAWLGLNAVAGNAFAISIQSGVFNDHGYKRQVRDLWAHAIATGFYGRAVASMIGQNQDTAFLCGLLHSIGKPFVVHTVNQCRPSSAQPLSWSTMLTLIDQWYIEVGRQLAEAWNFPYSVTEAINLHQHHCYHLATCPTKGAAITCLAKHLATYHLDAVAISEETLRALPITAALNLPSEAMNGIFEIKDVIQTQIESLLL